MTGVPVEQQINLRVTDVAEFDQTEFIQAENSTDFQQLNAVTADGSTFTYSSDDAFIEVLEDGRFRFREAPDFENALDADGNNVYTFTVEATSDLTGVPVEQQINLRVTDVAEFDQTEFIQAENSTEFQQLNAVTADGSTFTYSSAVSYTHLTLPTIYSV